MRKTIFLALLLISGAAVAAPQWVAVADTINGKLVAFVDLGSIRIDGDIRRAWFKYVSASASDKVSFNQQAFNCADETSRVEAVNVRYEVDKDSSQPAAQHLSSWTPIAPKTLRDLQRRFICKGVPK